MYKANLKNMHHVKATLNSEHKIIYEDDDTFVIFNKKARTYIAEGNTNTIIDKIKKLKITRLETSNKNVFEYFYIYKKFKHYQICLQCYHSPLKGTAKLEKPTTSQANWIAKTYGTSVHNIAKMCKNNEIFIYKLNRKIISYVGVHIDGSIGFLYTRPEYRNQGYATKIEKELFKMKSEPIFAQILQNNKISVAFHKKNGWKFNKYKIYWLFNESF